MQQIVQRAADICAIELMRQAVNRHQNGGVPPNFGHGRRMVGTWSGYGRIDLVTTYLAQAQHQCGVSLVGTQGGRLGHLTLRNLRAPNGPWRQKCPDMQHFQAALCLHLRDDHAVQLGIASYSGARLTVREMHSITDQLAHLRANRVADRLNRIVIHARTGMPIKAPWEQYMVHMRAYPFKGQHFHGYQSQSWILYVLNTFPRRVSEMDVLNPAHHEHIGVGLCILFFEVSAMQTSCAPCPSISHRHA